MQGASLAFFAPITGAWIETGLTNSYINRSFSHPSRVRGLKHCLLCRYHLNHFAPITGAWIETYKISPMLMPLAFAPITGAWIETLINLSIALM